MKENDVEEDKSQDQQPDQEALDLEQTSNLERAESPDIEAKPVEPTE